MLSIGVNEDTIKWINQIMSSYQQGPLNSKDATVRIFMTGKWAGVPEMALKDTVSKWHTAVCYLEGGCFVQSIQKFLQINSPSAKIIYNVGCVYMILNNIDLALQYFSESIEKDRYLAIAYFLRGVCYCRGQRLDLAQKDFSGILASLPKESINYQQLGAAVSLDRHTIEQWLQASTQAPEWKSSYPRLQPLMDYVFRPPKKMVASLKKENFLGRAKVISSVQENDIIYAEEKKMGLPSPTPAGAARLGLPSPPSGQGQPQVSRAIPPPPVRRPPHLTASVKEKCKRRWKSMELLSNDREENLEGAFVGVRSVYQLAQASDDSCVNSVGDYSHLVEGLQDSDNGYQPMTSPLCKSCPQIKIPLKRPLIPPRPKVANKPDKTPRPAPTVLVTNSSADIPKPLAKPFQVQGSESEETPKSVLARAHPSLFQGIPFPSGSPLQATHSRKPFHNVTDRRGADNSKQKHLLPNTHKPTNSSRQTGEETKTSPKPVRPPPPKTLR